MLTMAERDARRLIDDALQATSAQTFISSTSQVWIAERLKTAQALLATSISLGGRAALAHVTRARDFVEAIEAPRLREALQAALYALDTVGRAPVGLSGLGRGEAGVPASLMPPKAPEEQPGPSVEPTPAQAVEHPPGRTVGLRLRPPTKADSTRGWGLVLVGAATVAGLIYYGNRKHQ